MYTNKCNACCENVLRAIAIKELNDPFTIVTNSTITPKNNCKYFLKIPCSLIPITEAKEILPVVVVVNDVEIPLQNIVGNDIYSDQIRCFNVDKCGNIFLRLVYGSTPSHFKIINQELCFSGAYGVPLVAPKSKKTKKATAEEDK